MTTVTITETSNAVTVDDENVQVVDVRVVNTATTTSAGLMSSSDKSKLDSIETGADVTDATNVEAAGAVMETDTSTTNMQFVVDEDNMASDSASKIPTQQSVKAYVDSQISSKDELSELSGDLDDISDGTNHVKMTNAERTKLTGIETGATADQSASEIKSLYESNTDTNAFTDSEQTKLSGIENNATADQTASEIRTLVDSATDSNVFTDADHTKLDGIEANATADQTDAEIKTAYENNSDTNAFTDSEKTKLSGIETNATADQSASEILTALKTVDGSTSGLDADLLDGQEGSYYQQASTALNTTTSFGGDVSGTYDAIVVADDSHNHVISNVDGLQTALDAKAPLASPALTGTPTAPTAAIDDSTTKIATTAFVQQELAQLVDSAPSTLDTLNEIAAAINDDANFNTTVTNSLANRLRVDTDAQGLTSTQQNNAKTNLGLDDVATSGAYSDLTGTPTNATTSTDGLMSSSDKTKLDGVEAGATADQSASEIKTAYESNADTNAFTDAQQTKLTGIEANATADQTDSEIKTAYENNDDTNAFTDAEKTKLSNIESNATADQSASQILTLIKTVDGTTSGLDADVLDGQEGSHYLDYNNFTNTPTIPTNNNELTNGAGYITSADGGNAQTLDSLDSTSFLRSDAADTKTSGNLTFNDDIKAVFGTVSDLQIWHDGTNSNIVNGTGSLIIADTSGDVKIQGKYGEQSIVANNDGSVELYYDNALRFTTTTTGAKVTGGAGDGVLIIEGDTDNVNESDTALLQLTQDGGLVNAYIGFDGVNNLFIKGTSTGDIQLLTATSEVLAKGTGDGAFELYHDNSKKLETTSTGATITGVLTADGVDVGDDERIRLGASQDLEIYHISSSGHSIISESGTGNLFVRATNLTLDGANGEPYLRGIADGAVELYHNNSKKLETTSTGAEVTGDLTVSGDLFVNGGTLRSEDGTLDFGNNSGDLWGQISFQAGANINGFSSQFDNAIRFTNEQGGTIQHMLLLDSGANNAGNLWGISVNDTPIFGITGQSHLKMYYPNGASNSVTISPTTPTADRTITLPDASGTVALTSDITGGGAGFFQGENGNTGDTTNGKGDIFRTHEQVLNTNTTIATGDNSGCFFSLEVATGVTLTVNGNLVIA